MMTRAIEAIRKNGDKVGARSFLARWRWTSRLIGLVLLGQWGWYGLFRCPFIVPFVSCESCPVITCHGRITTLFRGFWLVLPLSALLVGRGFCGWLCPGGLVTSLLGGLGRAQRRTGVFLQKVAPCGKYLALLAALFIWLVLGQPREVVPIRIGDFFGAVRLTFEHASTLWLIRTGLVLCCFAAGLFLAGFWCRYCCPTGGMLELLARFSPFGFHRTGACHDCGRCRAGCELGRMPGEAGCSNCGDCIDSCPAEAVRFGRKSER